MDFANTNNQYVNLNYLDNYGTGYSIVVVNEYRKIGRNLDLNELLKVSKNEEASFIRFETLDQISVIVPVYNADGTWNKIE